MPDWYINKAPRTRLLTYKIEFKRSAAKALKKVPKRDWKCIHDKIDRLAENLPDPNLTKM